MSEKKPIYSFFERIFLILLSQNWNQKTKYMNTERVKCLIIGSGPAGYTAAIYAARADLNPVVLEGMQSGGQLTITTEIENFPGYPQGVAGTEMMSQIREQAERFGTEVRADSVIKADLSKRPFCIETESGAKIEAESVIIATGSHHRQLGLEKENKFTGEGVSYCAVCDGAFYKDKDVAVIGGGNSALQEAILLSKTSKSVTVVQNLPFLTGEIKLREEIEKTANISVILSSVVLEILGEDKFEGIRIKNTETDAESDVIVDSIFVAIGQQPENEPFKDVVELNEYGYIISDETCIPKTNSKGIYTAGDCRTKKIRQIATAISDGATAALEACNFVDSL